MNPLLQKKLYDLDKADKYECWYLVKQPTKFESICLLVSFLKDYKSNTTSENLSDFINKKIDELNADISKNYRALRIAAFFGLIKMTTADYKDAVITDTFEEISRKCSGHFEQTNLYADIIQRQIEKMFISTEIDERCNDLRKSYRLYPVMLLYKILIELGHSTGKFSISMLEYRYFVATTKIYSDFLDTLILIKLLRADKSVEAEFEQYRQKFDNRLIQALKQLPTLIVDGEGISLEKNFVREVAEKVFIFEQNPEQFQTDKYVDFLCSPKSLFDLKQFQNEPPENERLCTGNNILLYGVPGSGKSWTIEHEYCNADTKIERVVFHPDYTYSDFIGQILPAVNDDTGIITYKFSPGPFTTILKAAYQNPNQEYILIIEEINRGNAPAIFGEVFQLLDRMTARKNINGTNYPAGTSEYGISNRYMANEIYGEPSHKIRIPSNLSIIGTMNTSDQNVFTLDTAFQRRWNMRLIENSFDTVRSSLAYAKILDTNITWQHFCETVNELILENKNRLASAEDKRLGVYFIHEEDLHYDSACDLSEENFLKEYNELLRGKRNSNLSADEEKKLRAMRDTLKQNRKFPEKVIKYLWDDAFKFNVQDLFDSTFTGLEMAIHHFIFSRAENRFKIFRQEVYERLLAQ